MVNIKHGTLYKNCPVCGKKVKQEHWGETKGDGATYRTLRIIHIDGFWHNGCNVPFPVIERPSNPTATASGTNIADITSYGKQRKWFTDQDIAVEDRSLPLENPEEWGVKAASLPETTEEPEPEVEE